MKKKLTALLLALSLTLTLAACGGDAQEPAEDTIGAETGETVSGDVDLAEPDDGETDDAQDDTQTSEDEAESEQEPAQSESVTKPAETKPAETKPAAKPVETKPAQKPQENAKPEAEQPTVQSVDLSAFYQSLVNSYGAEFPADANVSDNAELVDSFYPGLSAVNTKQVVIYQPMMSAVVCEIALAEVSSSADVDAVKAIFQSRIDTQVNGGAWYPDSIAGWQNNSRIVSHGNYVMMIAWMYCDDAVSAFNALF